MGDADVDTGLQKARRYAALCELTPRSAGKSLSAIASTSERRPLYFFFQAEDGIRDVAVTGVQTCALPIWRFTGRRRAAWLRRARLHGNAPQCAPQRRVSIVRRCGHLFRPESHAGGGAQLLHLEIGRASCRESGWIVAVAGAESHTRGASLE